MNLTNLTDSYQKIKAAKTPVYLLGIGLIGKQVFAALGRQGVEIRAILDNAAEKQGQRYEGVPILAPETCEETGAPVIVGIKGSYRAVVRQLYALGFRNILPYSIALAGSEGAPADPAVQLDLLHFRKALEDIQSDRPQGLTPRSVDIVITEKCSLRCRDCSNLMQYYTSPAHADFTAVMHSAERFLAAVDYVDEIRLLGGEPFLNPDLEKYLRVFLQYIPEKTSAILLYTNGTILPRGTLLQALCNERVFVLVSGYRDVNQKAGATAQSLAEAGVQVQFQAVDKWQDCAAVEHFGRTREQNRALFRSCCVRNLITLKDGKLFRCPFAANAATLRAIPASCDEFVALGDDAPPAPQRREEIARLLGAQVLRACDYCCGRSDSQFTIAAAIQAPAPLAYHKY